MRINSKVIIFKPNTDDPLNKLPVATTETFASPHVVQHGAIIVNDLLPLLLPLYAQLRKGELPERVMRTRVWDVGVISLTSTVMGFCLPSVNSTHIFLNKMFTARAVTFTAHGGYKLNVANTLLHELGHHLRIELRKTTPEAMRTPEAEGDVKIRRIREAGEFVEWSLWGGTLRVGPTGMDILPYQDAWISKSSVQRIQMPPALLEVLSHAESDSPARIAAVMEVRAICQQAWPFNLNEYAN